MDLAGFMNSQNDKIMNYINKYYGEIPRLRGIRFMALESVSKDKHRIDILDLIETKESCDYEEETKIFNKYAGQDVIYIHTRCGDCDLGYDNEDSNYIYCGAKEWEEKYKDLFLEHITDKFDSTYCTHYFKAVVNDEYKELIDELR